MAVLSAVFITKFIILAKSYRKRRIPGNLIRCGGFKALMLSNVIIHILFGILFTFEATKAFSISHKMVFLPRLQFQTLGPFLTRLGVSRGPKESEMSVDEIKAELELRGVDISNCVSRDDIVKLLIDIRATGKANPECIDTFNEAMATGNTLTPDDFDSTYVNQAIGQDGTLPGGLPAEMVQALSSDPEIMRMASDPKLQEIMKAVMDGGPDAMRKYMADPDALMLIQKLSTAMQRVQGPH